MPFSPSFIRDLPLAQAALEYAREQHRGQRRKSDAAPFILHPLEVASLLHTTGHGETVIAAGILHDTVEDTDVSTEDISERFGPVVARLVAAMTEDTGIEDYEARKAALREQIARSGPEATAVYAADKVAKVRELRAEASREPAPRAERDAREPRWARFAHYVESLAMLEAETPSHPLVSQLRFELEALDAIPPRV